MKKTFLSLALAFCTLLAWAQPRVVAHRGYWRTDGSAQNSIASLQHAARVGCWGCEFDVWLTADGVPVVNHDATIDDIRIEDTTYATLMNHRLANGEYLPTLQQFLQESLKYPDIKLIYELKPHRNADRENRLYDLSLRLLRELGLESRTEYISFSRNACNYIHQQVPEAKVAFLGGDISPKDIKEMGLTGIDYQMDVFKKNPTWATDAKKLGLEVNVWTVDGEEALRYHATLPGIDIITTNDPEVLIGILKK